MKIIQLAVTEGELFALTDTGHVFRLCSFPGASAVPEYQWQLLPLPVQIESSNLIGKMVANGTGEPCPPPSGDDES